VIKGNDLSGERFREYDEIDAETALWMQPRQLWDSSDPGDIARLAAQARLISAYEERK